MVSKHPSWCTDSHLCLQWNMYKIITYDAQNIQQNSSSYYLYHTYRILTHPYQCSPRPPSDFQNILLNMKLPFTPSSSQLSFSLTFPPKTCPHLHTCHVSCPTHAPPFDHPQSADVKSWNSSLCNILQSPAVSTLIRTDTFLNTLSLNCLSLRCSLNVGGQD